MEMKQEYLILFNAISEVIKELQEVTQNVEECLHILIDAQNPADEINTSGEDSET